MANANNTDLDLVDRISDLHDSILGIILSCLPTKNAVATSILSKRWKSVWMTVHNLDFCLWKNGDDGGMYGDDENMKFAQFVNRVLLLHDCRSLNKFSLVWIMPSFIPSEIYSWITTAITKNVHELFLIVDYDPLMELPVSLFSCDSLQCLDLNGRISISDAIVVCFPRLETLKLGLVSFKSEEAFKNLISGCPMLSSLHLDMGKQRKESYTSGDVFMYIISSTSLRRLELDVDVKLDDDYSPYGLCLEASSLEYLELSGFIAQVCVRGTLSSLVEAHFGIVIYEIDDYSEDTCHKVVKAVCAFDCAKALTLSEDAMLALSQATVCLSTKFKRLTKLEAEIFSCYSSLHDFIQCSDNLEVLTIKQNFGKGAVHPKCTAPVEVPKCLSKSLKVVEFKGYVDCDAEHELIGYMLKHGSVLEVIQLTSYLCDGEEVNFEPVKKIRRFPRKSSACKVELSGTRCLDCKFKHPHFHLLQFS